MSLIQTQLSLVHLDSGINLASAIQKTSESPSFSFDGVVVTTTPSILNVAGVISPRTIALKLVSGADVLLSFDGGANYPLSLHGNDDGAMFSLESRETTSITVAAVDTLKGLSGKYFDLRDREGFVRVWNRYPDTASKVKVMFASVDAPNVVPVNNSTVTIGSKTYRFVTSMTVPAAIEGDVRIPTSPTCYSCALNLIRAINHTGTPNTDYKCAAAHPEVTADPAPLFNSSQYASIQIRSKVLGLSANSIALAASTSPDLESKINFGSDSTVILVHGANPDDGSELRIVSLYTFKSSPDPFEPGHVKREATVAATMANLVKAINHSGVGNGSDYVGTQPNSDVICATAFSNGKLLITLRPGGETVNQVGGSNLNAGIGSFLSFTDRAGATATETAGGVEFLTFMYDGFNSVAPTPPTTGRLVSVTLTDNMVEPSVSKAIIAATVAVVLEADSEFSASAGGAGGAVITATNNAVGGFVDADAGTSGWAVSSTGAAPAAITMKSLGVSELVVAVTPN